jgi:hypothetical protein
VKHPSAFRRCGRPARAEVFNRDTCEEGGDYEPPPKRHSVER